MPLCAKLVVVGGEVTASEIPLRLPATIGRGRGQSIVLPHPLVSRQHCELFERDGQLMVRDLGSLNGTFVNNRRVTESPLRPGELLTIGTVTFRAIYEPAGEAPPSAATVRTAPGEATVPATPPPHSRDAATATPPAGAPAHLPPRDRSSDKTEPLFSWDEERPPPQP